VIGFFYTKDLLRLLDTLAGARCGLRAAGAAIAGTEGAARCAARVRAQRDPAAALHVPESKTIRELADEFVGRCMRRW